MEGSRVATVLHPARSSPEPVAPAPRRPRPRDWVLTGAWVALVAPFCFELLAILRAGSLWFLNRVPDDAYYYVEIATRIARGEGSTFDGINATNGYHPLWQGVLVPLAGAFSGETLLRASLVLGLACTFAATLLVVGVVARVTGPLPAVVGGAFAVQYGLPYWVDGMESPVMLLTLALLLVTLERAFRTASPRWCTAVGAASSLVVLARFDAALVIVAVPVVLAVRLGTARAAARWVLGAAAVGVPFGLWWLVRWEHVLSTSATVKAGWAKDDAARQFGGRLTTGYLDYLVDVGGSYVRELQAWVMTDRADAGPLLDFRAFAVLASIALLALVVVAVVHTARRRRSTAAPYVPAARAAVVVVAALVVVKAVVDVVGSPVAAASWYSAPQRFLVAFAVGAAAVVGARVVGTRIRAFGVAAGVVLAVVLVPANAFSAWDSASLPGTVRAWQFGIAEATDWIAREGPKGRYGALDAGLAGFRLDGQRELVNLDGLVNSYEFAPLAARAVPLVERFRYAGIDYFVNRLTPYDRERIPCGRVIWRSTLDVPFQDPAGERSRGPIAVVDVRDC